MIDAEGWRRRETVRFWSSLVSVCVVVRCDWGSVAVRSAGEEAVGVCCCFCCCCCVALCVAVPLSAVGSIEGERSDETLSEGVGDTVVNWSLLMETEAVPTTVPTVAVCVGVGSSEVVRPLLVFGGDNVTSALGETEAEAAANNVADRSAVPVLVARAEAEAVFFEVAEGDAVPADIVGFVVWELVGVPWPVTMDEVCVRASSDALAVIVGVGYDSGGLLVSTRGNVCLKTCVGVAVGDGSETMAQARLKIPCGSVKAALKVSEGTNDTGGTPPHDATEANITPALVVGYVKSERRDARRSRRAPQVRAVTAVATTPDVICA